MLYLLQLDPRVPSGAYGDFLIRKRIGHRLIRLFAGEKLPDPTTVSAVLLLGGYMGVHDGDAYPFLLEVKSFLRRVVSEDVPLLGICLGGQLLAEALGGDVASNRRGERGVHRVFLTAEGRADPLFTNLPDSFPAFQWHNDSFTLPPGAFHLAASAACPRQAFRLGAAVGLQFHPEVDGEIVRFWSAPVDPDGAISASFESCERRFREISSRLLENFLLAAL